MITASAIDPEHLAARLRAFARGIPEYEAAVALLVEHGYWLTRCDFVETCIESFDDQCDPPLAWLDWDAAAGTDLQAGTSAQAIRLLAAALVGVDTGHRVLDLLGELDAHALSLVRRVIPPANARECRVESGR
jgi:hypothetical protein